MNLVTLKLVTVIAESFIADRLTREILRLGATGFTSTTAEGQGSRGVRASEWEGKNVKIETLASEAVAEKILKLLSDHYFTNYAVVVYVQDVGVVRGDKYV
jgi:nitrogen regulatory protein P-II 2